MCPDIPLAPRLAETSSSFRSHSAGSDRGRQRVLRPTRTRRRVRPGPGCPAASATTSLLAAPTGAVSATGSAGPTRSSGGDDTVGATGGGGAGMAGPRLELGDAKEQARGDSADWSVAYHVTVAGVKL